MTRYTRPGTIQAAVSSCYEAAGGVSKVARLLGLQNSTVSYGTEENEARPGGIGVNYLDRLAEWNGGCAVPIAQYFAALAGGVFQPVETHGVTNLFKHARETIIECGEAQAAMVRAAEQASAGNCEQAEKEIDDAVNHLLAFKAAMRAKPETEGAA